jgi:hypothetical protein
VRDRFRENGVRKAQRMTKREGSERMRKKRSEKEREREGGIKK